MRITIDRRMLAKRWLWFVGLWAGGVLALGVVAGLLKLVLHVV